MIKKLIAKYLNKTASLDDKMTLETRKGNEVGRFYDASGADALIVADSRKNSLLVYQIYGSQIVLVAGADWSIREKKYSSVLQLNHLKVKKEYRNKAIGQNIIGFLKLYAKDMDCQSIDLISSHYAMGFYSNLGFSHQKNDIVSAFDMNLMNFDL